MIGTNGRVRIFEQNNLLVERSLFLENWPVDLSELSVPHIGLKLTVAECLLLAGAVYSSKDLEEKAAFSIMEKISVGLTKFPDGFFVRLGSRSPKDVLSLAGTYRSRSPESALLALQRSQRIIEDCIWALNNNYLPTVFCRDWRTIEQWSEFRVFVRDRKIIGMCPYHAQLEPPRPDWLTTESIFICLTEYVTKLMPLFPVSSVVCDVFLTANSLNYSITPTLLELNPFCAKTDAILYSWETASFDCAFRDYGGATFGGHEVDYKSL
jgi:hypothetical protein